MYLPESGGKPEKAGQGLARKLNPFGFSILVSSCLVLLEISFDGSSGKCLSSVSLMC